AQAIETPTIASLEVPRRGRTGPERQRLREVRGARVQRAWRFALPWRNPSSAVPRIDILADPRGSPTPHPWGEDFSAFSYIASTSCFSARRESGRRKSMCPPAYSSTVIGLAPSRGGRWFTRLAGAR